MKITIENFGPIKRFDYDLSKDIVVTFGNNNIGKSYAMQVVYLLLKNLEEYVAFFGSFRYRYAIRFSPESSTQLKKRIEAFSKGDTKQQTITEDINEAIIAVFSNTFVRDFRNSCENTFGNFDGIIAQNPIIRLDFEKYALTISLRDKQPLNAKIYTKSTYLKRANSDYHKSMERGGRFDIYYYDNVEAPLSVAEESVRGAIRHFSIDVLSEIGEVYFLPASRSGIYSGMSAFSSIIAELSKNKTLLTKKIELPGISEPISDYFLMLSNIRNRENENLSGIYNKIEREILHGKVRFNRTSGTLVYVPSDIDHEFEMTEVSSMVSEISPIVAFLKYIISSSQKNGNTAKAIVFIEEPEAHLHPMNQIKLMQLFSQLNTVGIKIVMSSHSNYIFNKLNNLLLKGELSPETYSAILLSSEEEGSVSTFMPMDELGVDDTNFRDVSLALYDEREALIDAWNEAQEE